MTGLRSAQQAKEGESIPLHAGYLPGHRAERLIDALLIAKTLFQHLHCYALPLELAAEPSARFGQAWIAGRGSARAGQFLQEGLRRPNAEVGLLSQGEGTLAGPFRQVLFRVSLEPPSDPSHQKLFVV